MSQVPSILNLQETDLKLMLACGVHIGSENLDAAMTRYVFKRNDKGIHIINLRKTWEKLILAARVIVAIENPKDVCVVALSPAANPSFAQRAVLKFANHIGCRSIAGRITPGTFTNQQQTHYMEPRLLLASDPRIDHQPIIEASYVNLPVIAFTNTHHNLRGIDIAIPCNTSGKFSIALMYWLLAREVLRLRENITRDKDWEVMVDMFVYRDPEEAEKPTLAEGTDKSFGGGWGPQVGGEQAPWEGAEEEGEPGVAEEFAGHGETDWGAEQGWGAEEGAPPTGEWAGAPEEWGGAPNPQWG